jgi:hypothetical protein
VSTRLGGIVLTVMPLRAKLDGEGLRQPMTPPFDAA